MPYTLLTSTDQSFSGDLVRNFVSIRVSFRVLSLEFEDRNFYILLVKKGTRKLFK